MSKKPAKVKGFAQESKGNKPEKKQENMAKQNRPYIPDEGFGGAGYKHSREGHPGEKGPQQGIDHRPLLDDGV